MAKGCHKLNKSLLFYAQMAAAAYTTTPTFGAENSACRVISKNTMDGLTIGFPGTNNAASILADIEVDVVEVDGIGSVHEGFWKAFYAQQTKLMALKPAVVYGHSEGAALALIYAAELCLAGTPPQAVYAFEPPRISADPTIAELLDYHVPTVILTRNGDDLVTEVPNLLHHWQHPAPLMRIGNTNVLDTLEDHKIENVIRSIEQL